MSDEDKTTIKAEEVIEIGGRRVFTAQRLTSGNWLLIEKGGASRRTINNADFSTHYQRVPKEW